MFTRIAHLTTTRARWVLVVTVVFFAVAGTVGGPVAGLLNTDSDSFSDTSAESAQAVAQIEAASGVEATPELIVMTDRDDREALTRAREVLEADDDVARVAGGPDAGPPFVSRDGTRTYLAATYGSSADADHVTERLRDQVARIDGVLVGGPGPAYQQVNEQVEDDLITAELIAFPLLFLAALWVFRSAVAALLPLLVGGLTIVTALMALRGINETLPISVFALNLITGMGLGLAIDYSLFMVSRFREELERVGAGREAVARTVATAGRTVAFSAATVAGAGVALLVFPLRFLYSMGIGVILVSLAAAVVSLLVLPAVFAVLGERVNALAPRRWQRARAADARAENRGFWYRLSQLVMRWRVGFATAGAALLVLLTLPFFGVTFTGVDASVLPETTSSRAVADELSGDFEGADASPVLVAIEAPRSAASDVEQVAAAAADQPGVRAVSAPRFLGDDVWQVDVLPAADALDSASLDLVRDLRGLDVSVPLQVGGASADQVDQLSAIAANIPAGLAILAVLTFVALFLMTGSVVLPMKALVMNVLTVGATFGMLKLIFQDGRLEGPLDFTSQGALNSTQPVFIFAVVFGLSTDYAVFLLTRIKEARDAGAGERESVALGLQRTGRIVTAAAVLFAIALGAFATSEVVFIKQLGLGVAFAVLLDAFVVRALLVPSLMAMLGRANWWAPAPLRRLHDRVGLSEEGAGAGTRQDSAGAGT